MTKAVRNGIKRTAALLLGAVMIFVFAACGDMEPLEFSDYQSNLKITTVDSGVVTENDRFSLSWDAERAVVSFTDKESGQVWSTTPADYCKRPDADPAVGDGELLFTPISVSYLPGANQQLSTYSGQKVLTEEGRLSARKVDDGLLVCYFLDKIEMVIPLVYRLYDDHFAVSVDTAHILEGQYQLYSIDIAPYLASVATTKKPDKDKYLFVPSGCGALMYPDVRSTGFRAYKEELFGSDYAELQDAITSNEIGATMPVFGVNDGENALLGVIEQGAACCDIQAIAGDEIGYSSVYPTFTLRGFNTEKIQTSYGSKKVYDSYSDGYANTACTVGYYPVSDGYSGMAKRYRQYLRENEGMKSDVSTRPLYLQAVGGAKIDRSFLGIPYTSVASATTIEQVGKIAKSVSDLTGLQPVLQLKGFGASGINIGKIAGGLKIDGSLGSFGDLKDLQKQFPDIYPDFDVLQFSKSGLGVSFASDGAKAVNSAMASHFLKYATAMGNGDTEKGVYHLLARGQIGTITQKVTDKIKDESLNGASFSTIGQITYSDYRDPSSYNKGNMDADISAVLKAARKETSVMTQKSFAYAAAQSDHVIAAPSESTGFDALDVDVPFYQMVFKGSVSLSGPSLTLAGNVRDTFLSSVETGSGLLFTVADHYNKSFVHGQSVFAGAVFDGQKETLGAYVKEAKDLLSRVAGSTIEKHEILAENVTKTTFSDGTVLVTNRSNTDYSGFGTVKAGSFVYR